jgi:hypothetical protein
MICINAEAPVAAAAGADMLICVLCLDIYSLSEWGARVVSNFDGTKLFTFGCLVFKLMSGAGTNAFVDERMVTNEKIIAFDCVMFFSLSL